ncbi:hypothetical protein DPX16_11140 [Anabarilius grahami]|uniref:Uncharacterized protein n=1 Tax=Anabarilius grahami TaxID=495550 RepID=A0A3N0Y2J0_ANAGA|nr:hypothetical protein DPX16_11140 [Anabarilius grahami]
MKMTAPRRIEKGGLLNFGRALYDDIREDSGSPRSYSYQHCRTTTEEFSAVLHIPQQRQWSDSEESSRRLSRVTAYAEQESLVALGSDQKPVIDSFIQCKAGRQKEASP